MIISGHSLPVYLAWLAVPLTAFVRARTRFGLRVRAVGESPEAVHAAGLSVARLRFCGNRGERGLMWGSRVSASRWHRATAFCAT